MRTDPPPTNPWQQAAATPDPADGFDGFDATRRSNGGHTAWVWLRTIAVTLIVLAGLNQLVIRPVRALLSDDKPVAKKVEQVDLQQAGAAAAAFTIDYMTYGGPAWAAHRSAALSKWVDSRTFHDPASVGSWSGDAVLIPDSAIVDEATAVGEHSASVAVRVRVRSALPSGTGNASSEVPAPPTAPDAAYVPSIPAGYQSGPTYWVRLVVPVTASGSRLVIAGPGPVFSGDAPTPIELGEDLDSRATEKVAASVKKILPAYAAGDLQYIAADGSGLLGMGGAFTYVSSSDVTVVAGDEGAPRSARVTVTWELTGTGATIEQTYGLVLDELNSNAPVLQAIGVLTPIEPKSAPR